jgi:hypothetical protein
MLTRDQTQPRRHLPAMLKIMAIPQCSHEGRGAQGPDPLHLLQALTRFDVVADTRELACDVSNPGIQDDQLTLETLEEVAQPQG